VKVVLDTNVLVSAFAARGLCEAVFEVCLVSHEIVVSEHILKELRRSLTGKIKLPPKQADAVVGLVREHATVVKPSQIPPGACRDQTDLPVLGTAIAGGADFLVTGDRDLLDIGRFQSVPILSPRTVHDELD
jgi:uncharacterized protein